LLADLAQTYPLNRVSEITEVQPDTIRRLALDYARRKPVATYRGMGMQRTFHGDLTFMAINTLAAVTGNLYPGSPRLYVYEMYASQPGIFTCNFVPILKLYDVIASEDPHPVKALWIAKHNFLNQLPDSGRIVRELLPKIDFIVVVELFMNASAQYADIVLPACTFYEQSDLIPPTIGVPGGPKYFQLQNKVIEAPYECKPDPEILKELARRMDLGDHFEKTHEQVIESILASGYPAEVGITLEMLGKGPVQAHSPDMPEFSTPSGRMEFYIEKLVDMGQQLPCYMEPLESKLNPLSKKYPLVFLNTHTRYRTHSIFANLPWLSYLDPEPVLEIHPNDAEPRGVRSGDVVRVLNDRGAAKLKAKVHEGISPGTVNVTQGWWPEHFLEGSHQALTHAVINSAQEKVYEPNSALYDVLVEIEKVREG
jgi:molybdopterin-containing oxidoreductase family molybdopterin binding subunit